jgi:C4-dicarboxylate transporter DctM subunit
MSTGGVARRIIRFAIAVVGWFRGGLAMASVFACMMFAALSGSSPATVVAIGTIVIAGMVKVGYTKEFAAGVICNAGTLGILIPPSIVMVVYAAATDVSVGRMFLGGVIPGLLAGLMLMIAIYIAARIKNLPAQPFAGFGEVFDSAKDAGWGLTWDRLPTRKIVATWSCAASACCGTRIPSIRWQRPESSPSCCCSSSPMR